MPLDPRSPQPSTPSPVAPRAIPPGRRTAFGPVLLVCLVAAAGLSGCSQNQQPALPLPAVDPAPPPPPPPPVEAEEKVIVIEQGGEASRPSLAAASRKAREEKAQAPHRPSVVSINDKNLHEYSDGEVTWAEPGPNPDGPDPDRGVDVEAERRAADGAIRPAERRGEDYWRTHMLDLRLRWREALDQVEELEGEVADLRRRFYAEDDPYVRDGRIKPAWDRALDRLERSRLVSETAADAVAAAVEEGRRSGALPGWLREGIELEPVLEEDPEADIAEPTEPVVLETEDLGGGGR